MAKVILYLVMVLVLCSFTFAICNFEINNKWTEGVIINIYEYGKIEDSRFFLPNVIKIYGGYNEYAIMHELTHYNTKKPEHDGFFWLSYYRIQYGVCGELNYYE